MVIDTHSTASDFGYADTRATQMFAQALSAKSDLSQRALAHLLGYKTSVVVSHMASGRAPIPIDRALEIAAAVGVDRGKFLLAVLEQRYPSIDFAKLLSIPSGQQQQAVGPVGEDLDVMRDLERVAGKRLAELPEERLNIVRDVLTDRDPSRRWLTLNELPLVEDLRDKFPALRAKGIAPAARANLLREPGSK